MILTYRFRLRDKHAAVLIQQSRSVNYVWNYCNETQRKAVAHGRKWLNEMELQRLTSGSSKELGVLANTIGKVCQQFVRSRIQHKKAWLRFRSRRSLGWVPFKGIDLKFDGKAFKFAGVRYYPMHYREIPSRAKFGTGSFSQDARGRWYINIPLEVPDKEPAKPSAIGIDLGLKSVASLSTGETIGNPQHYRCLEDRLGKAKRAGKKRLAQTLAVKAANSRVDFLHKASARIALSHDLIFVGDVSSSKLARTNMAKSVLDAGWYTFKQQLAYKAIRHGGRLIEVDEAYTSQTCSSCGCLSSPGRPGGIAGLGIREWTCSDCGAVHDRDHNAAKNILRLGLETLVEGARRSGSNQTAGAGFGLAI